MLHQKTLSDRPGASFCWLGPTITESLSCIRNGNHRRSGKLILPAGTKPKWPLPWDSVNMPAGGGCAEMPAFFHVEHFGDSSQWEALPYRKGAKQPGITKVKHSLAGELIGPAFCTMRAFVAK